MKRGERAQVRTDMVEFILSPCRFRSQVNFKFGHLTSWLFSEGKEMYKKV